METWNRLTVTRGEGKGDKGGKKGKRLDKEPVWMTQVVDKSLGIDCGSGHGLGGGQQKGKKLGQL